MNNLASELSMVNCQIFYSPLIIDNSPITKPQNNKTVKKYLVSLSLLAILAACGGNEEKKETSSSTTASATEDLSSNPDYTKGLELIGKSDCLTCHKVGDKLIGPSYKEVAAKYDDTEENITMLADKIIKGGQGVWGSIPMTPHPAISADDAKAMVKYIFLLKK